MKAWGSLSAEEGSGSLLWFGKTPEAVRGKTPTGAESVKPRGRNGPRSWSRARGVDASVTSSPGAASRHPCFRHASGRNRSGLVSVSLRPGRPSSSRCQRGPLSPRRRGGGDRRGRGGRLRRGEGRRRRGRGPRRASGRGREGSGDSGGSPGVRVGSRASFRARRDNESARRRLIDFAALGTYSFHTRRATTRSRRSAVRSDVGGSPGRPSRRRRRSRARASRENVVSRAWRFRFRRPSVALTPVSTSKSSSSPSLSSSPSSSSRRYLGRRR